MREATIDAIVTAFWNPPQTRPSVEDQLDSVLSMLFSAEEVAEFRREQVEAYNA